MKPLKVAVIGRTAMLLAAARRVLNDGHRLALVATCKPSVHEKVSDADFAALATEADALFLRHRELDSPQALALLDELGCDIAISMNWLTLISEAVRSRFRLGVFNAHPGDLPRFKGNACPNWAILAGETQVALTIHRMVDALDSGPIALKRYFALEPDSTISDVYDWLGDAVPDAFAALLASAADGSLILTEQSGVPADSLRCYPRRPEDGRIDWEMPIESVLRLVRASGRPFDGAYTMLEGRTRLTIWRASPVEAEEQFLACPGQVAYSLGGDPVIAGQGGYARLTEISLDGFDDSAMAKAEVLRSLRNRLV